MHETHMSSQLPAAFCWTRFGTEAGEGINSILARKEVERRCNEGLFLWGIGNSVRPGLERLLEECARPEILFSPIRSRPRPIDVAPAKVLSWRRGEGLDGEEFEVPETMRVTSSEVLAGRNHYALVCRAAEPLCLAEHGRVDISRLRNIASGRRLGASQVTAVVSQADGVSGEPGREYVVAMRATLDPPYLVRLTVGAPAVGVPVAAVA
jgi:hypothetical protein